jgi:ubiquinone/menaquinone biosynthesis C-methylase UbiE
MSETVGQWEDRQDDTVLAERYDRVSDGQYRNGLKLIKNLGIQAGEEVLDVGCGTGRITLLTGTLVGPRGRIAGIDPSPERIAIARRHAVGLAGVNILFETGDANNLSRFRDNSFDVVYLNIVLHWVEDKEDALAQIYRVLRPGGRLGITTGDRDRSYTVKELARKVLEQPRYAGAAASDVETSRPVNEAELRSLLEGAGFLVKEISTLNDPRFFETPQACIEYVEASTSGTFLATLSPPVRTEVLAAIRRELEKTRTGQGIVNTYHTIHAIARK